MREFGVLYTQEGRPDEAMACVAAAKKPPTNRGRFG